MIMKSTPKDKYSAIHYAAIEKVLAAITYASQCVNGVIFQQTNLGLLAISRCGGELPCDISYEFDARIRAVTSFGDVVVVNCGEYQFQNNPHYSLEYPPGGSLICVSIKDGNHKLHGVVVVGCSNYNVQLSSAQRYALHTLAAELSLLLKSEKYPLDAPVPPLERLRLLESVVVNAKDAILITEAEPIDLPGPRVVYSNPAFEQTTGFTSEEMLGQTPRILQSVDTDRGTLDKIRDALSKWEPIEVELINARKDGSPFWVELSIVPVADEKGWFTHWISVQRDISMRKEAEKLAREAYDASQERIALESRLHERERISAELAYAAYHDELTSLHNRAYLMMELEKVFSDTSATKVATVLFVDLDGFKLVNDSLGHLAGDELLVVIARRMQASIRSCDVLVRLGGDEFAILITSADHSSIAKDLADRIIERLNLPIKIKNQDIFVSSSIGVATADFRHSQPEDLLRDADVAMYSAKSQGGGRWSWFDSSMRDAAVNQLRIQNALRQAIVEKDFVVFYQPIYSSGDRKLVGLEALLRWVHLDLGIIGPDRFVTLAEELGVIQDLGAWVMHQAATDVQQWRTQYPQKNISLNVNVSGRELTTPGYLDQISTILRRTGLPASAMQIEVTESVFLLNPELVAEVLSGVRSLGIHVALDDFGTGYSSLSYIDQYPIDAVKIDKSFVSRMMHLPRSKAIVESVLSLGRALKLDIVAEGVETSEQLALLEQMECPYVQGYFFNRPVPQTEIARLLAMVD